MSLRVALFASLSLLLAACGSSSTTGSGPKAGSGGAGHDEPSQQDGDGDATETETEETDPAEAMTLEEAKKVVATIEARLPFDADNALATPKTVEDVESILKRDQVTLFPRGISYLQEAEADDRVALALHGQIELAWGEAYMLVAEILTHIIKRYRDSKEELGNRKEIAGLTEEEEKELAEATTNLDDLSRRLEAFKLLAIEHISIGSAKADEVIQKHPDDYVGYRVAADYYRMVRNWESFAAMLAKIEETNPDSNGLVFLKGTAATQRDKNTEAAIALFRKALERDPGFVRAQAHLFIITEGIDKSFAEFEKLKALNPEHQLIDWAGEGIKKAYEDWQKEQGPSS